MKLFAGAVAASLVVAVVAHVEPAAAGPDRPVVLVSDFDGPYMDAPPPLPPLPPASVPGPGYGYQRNDYRGDGYGPPVRYDGSDRGYGYAPALLPLPEVYAVLRDNGFSPLGAPRQRGLTYIIAALDRGGEDGKLIIDARNGRILRFVPAFQWGGTLDRMRYEPEAPAPASRGPLTLPPPTVIKAEPQALPVAPPAPRVASRGEVPAAPPTTIAALPKSPVAAAPKPMAAAPRPVPQQRTAAVQPRPAEAAPAATQPAPVPAQPPAVIQAKPETQILPTQPMPPAEGLE